MNGSNHHQIPLRSSAILNIEKKLIKIVSYGQYEHIHILVTIITPIEYKTINKILLNQTLMVSILVMDVNVVVFTDLMN